MLDSIPKTIKMFTSGGFNRSESGRTASLVAASGQTFDVSVASRKDVRDMVRITGSKSASWAATAPYLRGQILYRVAEMLAGRQAEFMELESAFFTESTISESLDVLLCYAGWADKTGLIFGTTPDVPGHSVSTSPVPLGASGFYIDSSLADVVHAIGASLASGNACIVLVPPALGPLVATFGEVLATSDVPAGVVQLAAADQVEAVVTLAGATEIRSLDVVCHPQRTELESLAAQSLTRCATQTTSASTDREFRAIRRQLDYRTVWVPLGR